MRKGELFLNVDENCFRCGLVGQKVANNESEKGLLVGQKVAYSVIADRNSSFASRSQTRQLAGEDWAELYVVTGLIKSLRTLASMSALCVRKVLLYYDRLIVHHGY